MVIPTNFYADELIRGEPQMKKWKMNYMYDARVWVRPRTTTRVELIRGDTGKNAPRLMSGFVTLVRTPTCTSPNALQPSGTAEKGRPRRACSASWKSILCSAGIHYVWNRKLRCNRRLKRLAARLAEARDLSYSTVMGWLRCRLSFCLVRCPVGVLAALDPDAPRP